MGPLEFPAWDPVLFSPFGLHIRFYGLMYVVAFVCGGWILGRLARRGFLPIDPERVGDFVFYAVFGTILGGRLGYALFYKLSLFENPADLLALWDGGLSFHGGLIGVITALALFARRHRAPIGRVLDSAALAVTPGILAVRFANFVNGELYGRVTGPDTPLAMRFPTDLDVHAASDPFRFELLRANGGDGRAQDLMIQYAYRKIEFEEVAERLPGLTPANGAELAPEQAAQLELLRAVRWEDIAEKFPYRHPSQLYEAGAEGLLLGLILMAIFLVTRRRPLPAWTYGGVFMLGYGVARTLLENVRQPDRQFRDLQAGNEIGYAAFGMTQGQLLSLGMIVIGVALIVRGVILRRRMPAEDADTETAATEAGETA